jgi:hypothetical protein
LVEAAVLLPFVLGIFLGIIEFSFVYLEKLAARNYLSLMSQSIGTGNINLSALGTRASQDRMLAGDLRWCARSYPENGATPDCALGTVNTASPDGSSIYNVFIKFEVAHDRLTPVGALLKFALPTTTTERINAKFNGGLKPRTACNGVGEVLQFDGTQYVCGTQSGIVRNAACGGAPSGTCPSNTSPRYLTTIQTYADGPYSGYPGDILGSTCLYSCDPN